MKHLILFSIFVLIFSSAQAAFLTITEKSTTKTTMPKHANPMIAKMMKANMPAPESEFTKKYVHDGKIAFDNEMFSMLADYKANKLYTINHKSKTYTVMSLEKLINSTLGKSDKNSSKFKKLKKRKKILGKNCSMYKVTTNVSLGKNRTSENIAYACILMNPPAAWQEMMSLGERTLASVSKSATKGLNHPAAKGLRLYEKSKINLGRTQVGDKNSKSSAFMPITEMITIVTNLSEKPFPISKVQIPKGYKRKVRKKRVKRKTK